MNSKFIIKVGEEHYGSDFHINQRSINNWPKSFLSENIEDARVFANITTAKAMATRIRNVLLEWVKLTSGSSHYEKEPITIIEIIYIERPIIKVKPLIIEDLKNE